MRFTGLFAILLCVCLVSVSAEQKPFTVNDLVSLKRVSQPALSPDGKTLVYTQRNADVDSNRASRDLWMLDLSGRPGTPKRFTSHEASDTSAEWAADSSAVYFLSSRSGSSQVWKISRSGGEAVQVTDLPLDVTSYHLSPTSEHLVVSLQVYVDCNDLDCTVERDKAIEESNTSGRLYTQMFVRHWDHWKTPHRSQLFSLRLDESGLATGDPIRLTPELNADTPSSPFGGPEEYTFTADGSHIILAARDAGRSEPWSTDFDLYRVSVDGSGSVENLTDDNPAWDTAPVVSEDGRYLAWLAMSRAGFEADRFRVLLRDLESGETRQLAEDWDRSPSGISFADRGRALIVSAQNLGQKQLFRIDVRNGKVSPITGKGYVGAFSVAGKQIVYGLDTLSAPVDFYRQSLSGGKPFRLTDVNRDQLSQVAFADYEQFTFAGWNDETVHAYVMKPVDYREGQSYPVAFLIHGGPQGSFGNHFHYRWNPQTYAGAGYATVFIDFHGSTGYGQAFTDSITGDWGGKPLEDLQKGLRYALQSYDYLDGDRICALGASYGGYMINWIAGNWSDRFDCLVNHDGIFDNRMMYYATEELWFVEWEHGGPHFRDPTGFERHNPANHVSNWKTPMLVIQGALDYRVPETQALATFTALQRQGIPSQFLHYPDENHWVLQPANSIQWHQTVEAWLDRWTSSTSEP